MKIGFDASRAFISQPTGTENYSYQLLKAISEIDRKNQYRVYARSLGNNNPQKPNDLITPARLATGSVAGRQLPDNFKYVEIAWPRLWTQGGLALEIFKKKPDILFIPAHTLPILRPFSLKTVVTIHDLGAEFLPQYHTYPNKIYLNASTVWAVRWATKIIAVSKATKNDLIKKLNADSEKIEVIYEGCDKQKFKIINDKLKITEMIKKYRIQQPYILFVGTIQPRKNLERLIEAFSLVAKRLMTNDQRKKALDFSPSALSLVIVGKPGWLYQEIYNAPKKYGIERKVKFLDYVDSADLPYLYNGAKLFILPSLLEGFGLPVLEAMVCGCPVVVSDRSSLPEVVDDAGIKINPEKSDEIADAITKIINDDDLAQVLREKGLKQAKKFSWEKCAQETIKVFEKVMTSNK